MDILKMALISLPAFKLLDYSDSAEHINFTIDMN